MRGHIKQRSEGSWSIVIELGRGVDGKRRQKWHTFKGTKREAEAELTRLQRAKDTGEYTDPSKLTVAAYLERYLKKLESTSGRSWHESCETNARVHLNPRIGSIRLTKLTPMHVEECMAELRQTGNRRTGGPLAPRSLHVILAFLYSACEQAVKWEIINRNPCDAVGWPRLPKAKIRALTLEETRILLDAAKDTPLYMVILLLVTTGMRRGEVLALRWEEIDLEGGTLMVRRALEQARGTVSVKGPKSESGIRQITLPAVVVPALRRHKAEQALQRLALGPVWRNSDLVLCQADGSRWAPSAISQRFVRLVKKIDIPHVRLHDLRHSHASQLLEQGVHAKVVSERLGHSKIATTLDIYSHLLPGIQSDVANRIDGAFRRVMGDDIR